MANEKLRTLLIEDDPEAALLIKEMLDKLDESPLSIERADNLSSALSRLKKGDINGVLLDLSLPDSQGLDTYKSIQAAAPEMPVVVLTGLMDNELARQAIRLGAQDYLVKGQVDGELLSRTLRYAMERKQAEKEIATARANLRALIENTSDMIWSIDRDYRLIVANSVYKASAEALYGKRPRPGSLVLDPETIPEGAFKMWKEFYDRALNGEDFVVETPSDQGDEGFLEVSYNPILNEQEEIIGVSAFAHDVTERILTNRLLRQAMVDYRRSNKDLKEFAYGISHDLREPLRMVISYLELLEQRYQGQIDPDADEFIGFAVDGANRMNLLIDDLLKYSRIGTRGKEFEATDCEKVLDDTMQDLVSVIEENEARVTHDPLPTVMADDIQLGRLLQNLIANAIKFHRDSPPVIHVSATREGLEWHFKVKDNGIGISPERHEQIFTIFRRLHTREEFPGTGMGLAISKKIVERHGGRIWVGSEPGQGSTFHFTIPVREVSGQ